MHVYFARSAKNSLISHLSSFTEITTMEWQFTVINCSIDCAIPLENSSIFIQSMRRRWHNWIWTAPKIHKSIGTWIIACVLWKTWSATAAFIHLYLPLRRHPFIQRQHESWTYTSILFNQIIIFLHFRCETSECWHERVSSFYRRELDEEFHNPFIDQWY